MVLDYQKKNRVRRILYSRITLSILLVVVILLGRVAWNAYQTKERTAEALERARTEYETIAEREAFLENEIERLETEEGIEEEIRTRYGYAEEGERVIFIVDRENDDQQEKSEQSFWQRVRGWFIFGEYEKE